MKIYACQLDIVWEDKPANCNKVRSMIKEAAVPAGSMAVLPEMFSTGFSMNVTATQESSPSQTEQFLGSLAKEHRIFLLAGLVAAGENGQRLFNQAVLFSPQGKIAARYSKIQPFTLGGEAAAYAAGTQIVTFRWESCVVAPFVCYDLRFPELFRAAVQQGAQLFVVIANWPVKRERHWITLLEARAIENQAYVVGVNRCGADPKFKYSGRTLIFDPHGNVLADAGGEEKLVSAEIDVGLVESWRKEFPALQDIHWGL